MFPSLLLKEAFVDHHTYYFGWDDFMAMGSPWPYLECEDGLTSLPTRGTIQQRHGGVGVPVGLTVFKTAGGSLGAVPGGFDSHTPLPFDSVISPYSNLSAYIIPRLICCLSAKNDMSG